MIRRIVIPIAAATLALGLGTGCTPLQIERALHPQDAPISEKDPRNITEEDAFFLTLAWESLHSEQAFYDAIWQSRYALQAQPFLVCTRSHEGTYTSVSPGGTYKGAYQFDQQTWNTSVTYQPPWPFAQPHPEFIGVAPLEQNGVPWWVQDETAWALYSVAGNGPWNGRC